MRVCTAGGICKHLGCQIPEFILIPCQTCRGNVRKKHFLHECELHGSCLPPGTPQAEGHGQRYCDSCDDFEATPKKEAAANEPQRPGQSPGSVEQNL